jgi:ferredoxin-NADP reductase
LYHRAALRSAVPVRLLYSERTLADVIYREELIGVEADHQGADIRLTLTREQPAGWHGYVGRIDRALLEEVAWAPSEAPLAYVCGPTGLVEAVASTLVELGHEASRIKTERFGPT